MAATGFTPISLYYTTTAAAVPVNTNLVAGELALNTTDEKLYFKNTAGTVKLIGANVTPIANGGTNAVTAAAALVSLGVQTGALGAEIIPAGTTADRPAAAAGYFRFNTTNVQFEGYNGTAWAGVGGASGGGGNPIMYENDSVVSVSYTMTSGKNASSTGPLVINAGIAVTVPSGSVWVIL